jgi:hypothetical protein
MGIETIKSGTLGEFNVGAAAAVALISPLSAQIDALLSLGIGKLQADIAARLNAALVAQANLSLQIGLGDVGLIASLKASIAALGALQAALAAGLKLPPVQLSIGAELGAAASLAVTLKAQLGGLKALINAALAVSVPAVNLAAQLSASLGAGPFFALSLGNTTLAALGSELQSAFSSGLEDNGNQILPGDSVFGVLLICKDPALSAALQAIIVVPP